MIPASAKEPRSPTPHERASWTTVQRFMLRTCGVVLADDQIYLADARLTGVAKQHGFLRIGDFVDAACSSAIGSPLGLALIDAMTTHETLFFRDAPFWQTLEKTVFPSLIAQSRPGAPIRIWSAACSTGQEPYSLAMLVAERFPEIASRLEIIATDVAEIAVERARQGVYSVMEVNRGLSAPRLIKHFEQVAGGFRVRDALRTRITWAAHNLLGGKPDPASCDLVLCRNVLIYFGETDRAEVTRRLFRAVTPSGIVGIGSTETLREVSIAPGLYARKAT